MTAPSTPCLAIHGAVAKPTLTVSKGCVPNTGNLSGVTELLTAKHRDLIMDEGLHAHTWSVTAYYPSEPFRDGRAIKAALRTLLDALPDSAGVLPEDIWSGEAIIQRVLVLANIVGASVTRPEGFEAWTLRSGAPLQSIAASADRLTREELDRLASPSPVSVEGE